VVNVFAAISSNSGKCSMSMWKCTTSKASARRRTSCSIDRWLARSDFSGASSSRKARRRVKTGVARVRMSPAANNVTSWPCAISAFVRWATTRSVPP
jgi:hypothetical protein